MKLVASRRLAEGKHKPAGALYLKKPYSAEHMAALYPGSFGTDNHEYWKKLTTDFFRAYQAFHYQKDIEDIKASKGL